MRISERQEPLQVGTYSRPVHATRFFRTACAKTQGGRNPLAAPEQWPAD